MLRRNDLKKILTVTGMLAVMVGLLIRCLFPDGNREEIRAVEIERIPYEEIQDNFKETGEEEGIQVIGTVETGEIRRDSEEVSQEPAQVNEFTYDEAQHLLRIAQAEAGNQGTNGMWLVMSVVLNRVADQDFPDNIKDVIYQPRQFSSVSDGHFAKAEVSPECHEALARIECGDVAPDIVGFEVVESSVLDRYFCRAFEYRDHRFYKER